MTAAGRRMGLASAAAVLAVMEVLTLLSALPIVTLMVAVHDRAAPGRKAYATAALASAFEGDGRERAVRRSLLAAGVLCLAGTVGPAVGNMRLQLVGVLGYAVALPIVAFLLLRLFGRDRSRARATGRPGQGCTLDCA